jgi:hypothetical protein
VDEPQAHPRGFGQVKSTDYEYIAQLAGMDAVTLKWKVLAHMWYLIGQWEQPDHARTLELVRRSHAPRSV